MKANEQYKDIYEMDFEKAFLALQENVNKLEGEELTLNESLELFKRGKALAKYCAGLLEKAELQIQMLNMDDSQILEAEE
jgi:exodeoxyribonuclease VII small subunit